MSDAPRSDLPLGPPPSSDPLSPHTSAPHTSALSGIAYVALGSNMGQRLEYLRFARTELHRRGITIVASSPVYCTEPVGGPVQQDDYYNAVLQLRVTCSALELLHICQEVEQSAGRKRLQHWGPRTLDLDILLYEDKLINTPELQVPHPRMGERRFVLEPLAALAPHLVLPGVGEKVLTLLQLLPEAPRVCKVAQSW
ncbi:MAG: 2-amino-4-hydroxy-6-hydroxymethyldihydropteridine diphosphokinase [Desulfuromonadaceae bacterium]|nr:2-amino-4-hydroxy-6-hydroxymethyldihydropteridine diphosphokinase [Desulfuromonadaceae bacterium]